MWGAISLLIGNLGKLKLLFSSKKIGVVSVIVGGGFYILSNYLGMDGKESEEIMNVLLGLNYNNEDFYITGGIVLFIITLVGIFTAVWFYMKSKQKEEIEEFQRLYEKEKLQTLILEEDVKQKDLKEKLNNEKLNN